MKKLLIILCIGSILSCNKVENTDQFFIVYNYSDYPIKLDYKLVNQEILTFNIEKDMSSGIFARQHFNDEIVDGLTDDGFIDLFEIIEIQAVIDGDSKPINFDITQLVNWNLMEWNDDRHKNFEYSLDLSNTDFN